MSKSDEEKSEGKLNLGLAQILSPALSSLDLAAPIPKPIENRAVEEMIPPALTTVAESIPPLHVHFQILFDKGQRSELLVAAEQRMGSHATPDFSENTISDEQIARLWWIKMQFIDERIPATILAAPLESVSKQLLELVRQNDEKSNEQKVTLSKAVLQLAAELLTDIGNALVQRGEGDIGESFLSRAPFLDPTRISASTKHTLERLHEMTRKKEKQVTALPEIADELAPVKVIEDVHVREGHGHKTLAGVAGLLGLLAIGIFFALRNDHLRFWEWSTTKEGIGYARAAGVDNLPHAQTKPPLVESVDHLNELSEVYYHTLSVLPADKTAKTERAVTSSRPNGAITTSAPPQASITSSNEKQDELAPKAPTEVIDTTGPIEEASPPTPRLESSTIANRNGVAPQLPNSRTPNQNSDLNNSDARTLARPIDIYEILVDTKVMALPSYRSGVVSVLPRGATVQVEASTGPWLKLRSRQGRTGFVLAQDAVRK